MKPAESAPEYWLDEHASKLLLYARQWVRSDASAEDVFQDAFVKFWQNREGVRDPVPYLYRCVRTTAMNWRRSRERRSRHEKRGRIRDQHDRPDAAVDQSDRHARIHQAVSELPADQREVVVMKIWGEMTFEQIGSVMSVPRSSAHATYQTAMNALQGRLGEET